MSDDPNGRDLKRRRRRARAEAADYLVGYAKPDTAHQFKPGNKMGARPRKPKPRLDFAAAVERALAKVEVVRDRDGRSRSMSRVEIVADNMVVATANNDAKARRDLMKYLADGQRRLRDPKDEIPERDYGAEVRAKIETMARHIEKQKREKEEEERKREQEPNAPGQKPEEEA